MADPARPRPSLFGKLNTKSLLSSKHDSTNASLPPALPWVRPLAKPQMAPQIQALIPPLPQASGPSRDQQEDAVEEAEDRAGLHDDHESPGTSGSPQWEPSGSNSLISLPSSPEAQPKLAMPQKATQGPGHSKVAAKQVQRTKGTYAPGDAVPLMVGPPATLKPAQQRSVLLELPPSFDVEGDTGVIGRVCGPTRDEQRLVSPLHADTTSSSEHSDSDEASPSQAPAARVRKRARDDSSPAAAGEVHLDLKGEVYHLTNIPLQGTAMVIKMGKGNTADVVSLFTSVTSAQVMHDASDEGAAAGAWKWEEEDDNEGVYTFAAGGPGTSQAPKKRGVGKGKSGRNTASQKAKPRKAAAAKRPASTGPKTKATKKKPAGPKA